MDDLSLGNLVGDVPDVDHLQQSLRIMPHTHYRCLGINKKKKLQSAPSPDNDITKKLFVTFRMRKATLRHTFFELLIRLLTFIRSNKK